MRSNNHYNEQLIIDLFTRYREKNMISTDIFNDTRESQYTRYVSTLKTCQNLLHLLRVHSICNILKNHSTVFI